MAARWRLKAWIWPAALSSAERWQAPVPWLSRRYQGAWDCTVFSGPKQASAYLTALVLVSLSPLLAILLMCRMWGKFAKKLSAEKKQVTESLYEVKTARTQQTTELFQVHPHCPCCCTSRCLVPALGVTSSAAWPRLRKAGQGAQMRWAPAARDRCCPERTSSAAAAAAVAVRMGCCTGPLLLLCCLIKWIGGLSPLPAPDFWYALTHSSVRAHTDHQAQHRHGPALQRQRQPPPDAVAAGQGHALHQLLPFPAYAARHQLNGHRHVYLQILFVHCKSYLTATQI